MVDAGLQEAAGVEFAEWLDGYIDSWEQELRTHLAEQSGARGEEEHAAK